MTNDSMPESYREAFHACLVRTGDWMTHGGPEPECYLENQPYPASTFFDFMTKFAEPMRQIDCQLALKIMGGVLEDEQADIQRDQSYGNAAKHLVRKIKGHIDYKREQARLLDGC
jgi:hypothetical protein